LRRHWHKEGDDYIKFELASIIVPAALLCLVTALELRHWQQSDKK